MRFDDFFVETPNPSDPWDTLSVTRSINMDLVRSLMKGPLPRDDSLATALAFTRVMRVEFEAYGTDSSQLLSDDESREALRSLRQVLRRQGVEFKPPWSDFSSFRTYWLAHNGHNSWNARRVMVAEAFQPILESLEAIEEKTFSNELATPVSPRDELGWPAVDEYVDQLRQRFRSASTPVDYKDVGNRCVGLMEALSAVVYDPAVHCPPDKTPPPVDKTDIRIGAYVDQRLPGSSNEELRGLVKKASALAHKMKHSPRADRVTAGIAADAVILLANILRRLREPEDT